MQYNSFTCMGSVSLSQFSIELEFIIIVGNE